MKKFTVAAMLLLCAVLFASPAGATGHPPEEPLTPTPCHEEGGCGEEAEPNPPAKPECNCMEETGETHVIIPDGPWVYKVDGAVVEAGTHVPAPVTITGYDPNFRRQTKTVWTFPILEGCTPPETTTTTAPPQTTTTTAPPPETTTTTAPPAETTTTVAPTTTAPPAETTTTLAPTSTTSTTAAPAVTSTLPPSTNPQPQPIRNVSPTAPTQLPRTGSTTTPTLIAGLSLLVVGAGLVQISRRRALR